MTGKASNGNLDALKRGAFDFIDRNGAAVALLSDKLFYFGELGMQEHESAGLLSGLLEQAGFHLDRGISGFPTAFSASYGSGGPVVVVHTEYDANPDNSQASGVSRRQAIVEGAPGHCEGHNCNATVMVAGAIAARYAMEAGSLGGTIRVIGAPAEEQLISRPYFVRDGVFADVDAALHVHIAGEFQTLYGLTHSSAISVDFTFHGESAHASISPWKARDALDGVVLMDVGMAQFREHMEPVARAHRVITNGGDQPNVIPATASVWWMFRGPTADAADRLFEQARRIAEGAALMSNTTLSVNVRSAVWPVRFNETLAGVVQANIERIGMPDWTAQEQDFAREVQAAAQVPLAGLHGSVVPLTGPSPQRAPSNDCGDVSWVVPMGRISFPANIPHVPFHHWCGGAALATSIAHKGTVSGSKALAATLIDLLADPAHVARAKVTFEAELGGTAYRSLLPADLTPPLDLNRALMDKFRPLMTPHYPKAQVAFR